MPARNSIKQYISDGYYHMYNRGVEKRKIFKNQQDYSVFLSYLKDYLLPKDIKSLREKLSDTKISTKERHKILQLLRMNNFADEITLLAYCLMPNHFHLFIKQKSQNSINKFIQSLCTRYTMYFNRKYKRVGTLFQSVYKAVHISDEKQFLHLSKYIHKQALALEKVTLQDQPCSFLEFLGRRKTKWIKPNEILTYFSKINLAFSYEAFVKEPDDFTYIEKVKIEDE